MKYANCTFILLICLAAGGSASARDKARKASTAPLDRYVEAAAAHAAAAPAPSPGSLWTPGAHLADAARDLRASQVDDIITVLVLERTSAQATGTTKTARASSVKASVDAAGGVTRATGPLRNMAGASGDTQLSGNGTTSREAVLSTTLTARITRVLPNGALVVEGTKDLQVNTERQAITVRGVARPADISPDNIVRSDHLAELEVHVNGRGVVGDAIRRPFFLYRLLLGLLPI